MKKRFDIWYYKAVNCKQILKFMLPNARNQEYKKLLKKNIELKNMYQGKRIFIVANGPSIKEERLDLLKDELVFTVNQMIRKTEFRELDPIANFWFDPAYFDEKMPSESIEEFKSIFKDTCNCNDKIINFVPLSAYNFLNKHDLLNGRVNFLDTSLYYYDEYDKEFEMTKKMVGFQNIVQYAIAMAIYMGFKEIYLLGCDSTGIITKINSVMQYSIEDCYAYELNHKEQNYVNSLLDYFTVEQQFEGWTRIFHLYKQLNCYCSKRDIKLINCSKKTIIEGISRIPLDLVIGREFYDKKNKEL